MIKTPLSTVLGGAFWAPGCTVIGGNTPTFDQQIQRLFATGEEGFFYDPNDLSTMYQDAAGTIPVTGVGQPVGLILDKSRGLVLGQNIVVNGTFDTDAAWSNGVGWSISNGKAVRVAAAVGSTLSQAYNFVAGKFYEVSVEYSNLTGAFYTSLRGGTTVGNSSHTAGSNSSGVRKVILMAVDGNTSFDISMSTPGGTGTFDNYSIKELSGNHAYQTTSAARPILQDAPRRIDFDAVDDKLITNLPVQLTGCTVVRSVLNVGTQILTDQAIPTTYEDNTDHCGLIVINRALTPSETSAIAAEFNKRAGV